MKLDLGYYFSIFLRRSPYFVLVTAVFASIGLTLALILPPEYEARATLLVEAEQIPENLASSTVSTGAGEQLRIIQRRLLARETLIDLASRLNLYPVDANGQRMSASDIVSDLQSRITFEQTATAGGRRTDGAAVLTISYRGQTAQTVALVTNEIVTLVLQENLEMRTEQAGDTLAFFRQEVDRLGSELDEQSVRLVNFQNEAGLALPENLAFLRDEVNSLQTQRARDRRTIVELEQQKSRLTDLFRVVDGPDAEAGSPLERQLAEAQQQLNDALLVFSPTNPRVSMLRARVAQLEQKVADTGRLALDNTAAEEVEAAEFSIGDEPTTEREVRFALEMEEIDRRIATLNEDIERASAEITELEDQIAEVPSNGVTQSKLQRDYENIQGQYNQAVDRLSVAATGERIELLAKGQRISVIEQATPPERPTKPNRPVIAAAGIGAGMFVGLAVVVLMEFLNRSIRRPVELTNRLGITPFAVLPYYRTSREIALRRFVIIGCAAFLLVVIPLALLAFHSFVLPLDSIIESLFNRVGFSVIG
ncbi:lipopolysaccharide biosynthesis protein [Meridianimarinicoccus roseus]|uniref:Lipopolysaccharide biosynthesis protein n=1 Tax=Meridianimarinicoccus roseus TaxID=2072018 RepID=A0A2V2LFJ7_9RHOB|nr:Wzz/FepE/Etk N-terminal domain-containing protein [Meridianimarinicoccus roseus]PWR04400.1 lipopolysaccharide biosynthesis protein [Meridianimarinicoccus roseus]